MRSYTSTRYKDSQEVLQPAQGGTGVTTQEEAINILGVIANSEKGKPGGIAEFEPGTRFIPPHILPTSVGVTGKICLEGNRNIPFKGSVLCKITNFDAFTNYQITGVGVEVVQNKDTLLITSTKFYRDPKVYINSDVFDFVIDTPVLTINGRVLGRRSLANNRPAVMRARKAGGRVVLSCPDTSIRQATRVGEATVYDFTPQNEYVQGLRLTPLSRATAIAYSGQGTKTFTVNNTPTVKTDVSTIAFNNADNILVAGAGDLITIPGTPQQGLPQYPNGLPPYATDVVDPNSAYVDINLDFYWTSSLDDTVSFIRELTGVTFWFRFSKASIINLGTGPSNSTASVEFLKYENHNPSYKRFRIKSVSEASISFQGRFFDEGYSDPIGRVQADQTNINLKSIVVDSVTGEEYPFNITGFHGDPHGNVYLSKVTVGNPDYPSGLPPYKPAVPGENYTDKIKMVGANFKYEAENFETLVYPWNDYRGGETMAIASTGTLALGSPRSPDSLFDDAGGVLVYHDTATGFVEQYIKAPPRTPYPAFGKALAFSPDGSELFVGAPGVNEVTHYKLSGNSFSQTAILTPDVVNPSQNFGKGVACFGTTLAIVAPDQGTSGVVYFLQKDAGGIYRHHSKFQPELETGFRLTGDVKMVSANKAYIHVSSGKLTGSYVVEISLLSETWSITYSFKDIDAPTENGFGQSFDISSNGIVLAVAAPGNRNTRGMVHLYTYFDDTWNFYDVVVDPNGTVGDGFGSQLSLGTDGKHMQVLSESFTNTQTLVYMD